MSNISGTAVDAPYGFKIFKRRVMGTSPAAYGIVSTSVTVASGDLLIKVDATGNLGIHTAGADELIIGIADQAGTAGDRIQYTPITENDILVAQSTSSTVVAQANLWDTCEVGGTTGVMGLNVGTATNAIFKILALKPGPGNTLGKWCELECQLLKAREGIAN